MAHRETAPYEPQSPQAVRELVQALEASTRKGGRSKHGITVKKATFKLPGRDQRSVDSWRMQDWDYKKPHLPTYARGLFTYKTLKGDWEIAARGYDKFFNHGEVPKTEWANVERNTRGPYELSVKENGCIIFIAGLDNDALLVCSKHSTGSRDDVAKSHAQAGEEWVDRQLKAVGKTREQLARKLREMNATAVAELCDDDFEEHVLAYDANAAGLYLHGINLNLPHFATYPGHLVDRFAEEWGFKKTMYLMEDDVRKVKEFLDKVAETGAYAGRDTEGFVIRCQARDGEDGLWHDWFFKYKFEEPYLMYRQWRECTRAVIAGRTPKYKKHVKVTKDYLDFARRQFAKDPKLMKAYNQNHGIIALRDAFLAERGVKGSDIIRQEIEQGEEGPEDKNVTRNVVLVPVATIGCGKTTVAVALTKLFDWGHQQNDNVQGRGNRAQRFVNAIWQTMMAHPVVIADRNNHQKREREQLLGDISKLCPEAKFVALHWVHDRDSYDEIRRVTRERVLSRGDNHQTIQAGSKDQAEIIGIMEGFMGRFQPVDTSAPPDDAFDLVIDLDVLADSRENLETVVARLSERYPKLFGAAMPTGDDLDEAIEAARFEYNPDVKHDLSQKKGKEPKHQQQQQQMPQLQLPNGPAKPKPAKLEFFAVRLLPSTRVTSVLDALFREAPPQTARFYRQLAGSRRVQSEFHVTLMHRASASQRPDAWTRLVELHAPVFERAIRLTGDEAASVDRTPAGPEPELGTCEVQLERVVWDGRVMCIVVRLLGGTAVGAEGIGEGEAGGRKKEEGNVSWETVNPVAHVTVGTASKDIKPKESNDLLQRWLKDGSGGETGIGELMIKGNVVLEGSVRGVLQRY